MYGTTNYANYGAQNQQTCYPQNDATPISMNLLNSNPKYYYFSGNSLSLQSRLEAITDEEANQIIDATITVGGI